MERRRLRRRKRSKRDPNVPDFVPKEEENDWKDPGHFYRRKKYFHSKADWIEFYYNYWR